MTSPLRGRLTGAALFALATSAVFAGPAAAAPATVTVDNDAFAPAAVTVNVGESVTWDFKEASHNAKGDGWSVNNSFGTGSVSKSFDAAGTFSYVCEAHPDMKGTVTVNAAAAPASTTPSAGQTQTQAQTSSSPTAAAAAPAAWTEPLARDTLVPRISRVRAASSRLTVVLSEDATVVVAIRRGSRQVRRLEVKGRRGTNRLSLNGRKLRAGRYTVRVVAIDAAGNESALRTARLRVAR